MFQSSQIQSSANDIRGPFGEHDMTAIVALLHGLQNIRRVICFEVVVALDNAFLVAFGRVMHLLVWALR